MKRRWNWVDGLLLPGALAALNTLTAGTWVRWLMLAGEPDGRTPAPSLGLIFGLVALGALTPRVVLALTASETRARWLVLVLGLAEIVAVTAWQYGAQFPAGFWAGVLAWGFGISREFIWLFAAPFLWWRGLLIASRDVFPERLEGMFWWGGAALALAYAFNAGWPALPPAEVFAVSLLFFVVGLAALALAGAEHSRRIAAAYSRGLGLNRPWLGTVAGLILALLALGLALAELSAPGFGPLSALWEAVTTPLLIALALVMGFIVEPLFRLWEAWLTRAPAATPTPAATPAPLFQPDSSAAETLSPAMLNTVTAADILILVSLLALAVWLVVHRWRVPKPADDGEVRDSVFSTSLLAEQLRALAARFRPRPAPEPPFLDLAGVAAARARIRRAFRAVLEQGQAAGLARAPGQTPQAYVGRLAEIWPDRRAALADLAGLYDLARYGADTDAPSEAQAQQAEQAAEPAAPPSGPA